MSGDRGSIGLAGHLDYPVRLCLQHGEKKSDETPLSF